MKWNMTMFVISSFQSRHEPVRWIHFERVLRNLILRENGYFVFNLGGWQTKSDSDSVWYSGGLLSNRGWIKADDVFSITTDTLDTNWNDKSNNLGELRTIVNGNMKLDHLKESMFPNIDIFFLFFWSDSSSIINGDSTKFTSSSCCQRSKRGSAGQLVFFLIVFSRSVPGLRII